MEVQGEMEVPGEIVIANEGGFTCAAILPGFQRRTDCAWGTAIDRLSGTTHITGPSQLDDRVFVDGANGHSSTVRN